MNHYFVQGTINVSSYKVYLKLAQLKKKVITKTSRSNSLYSKIRLITYIFN